MTDAVEVVRQELIVNDDSSIEVIVSMSQGLPGRPGLPGPAGNTVVQFIIASEDIPPGRFINLWNDNGQFRVRLASANGRPADGFVLKFADNGSLAEVFFSGPNTKVTDQTPGEVFLQVEPGMVGADAPAGPGLLLQSIGLAVSPTTISFQPQRPITLA